MSAVLLLLSHLLVLQGTPGVATSQSPNCCPLKTVGGVSYTLLQGAGGDDNIAVADGCKDECVYVRTVDLGQDQPERICFASGYLRVVCDDPSTQTPTTNTTGLDGGSAQCSNVIKTGPFGPETGVDWSDEAAFKANGPISGMNVAYGGIVDSIQAVYGGVSGQKHGGDGGNKRSFILPPNTTISSVSGTTLKTDADSINSHGIISNTKNFFSAIKFVDSEGSTYGPYEGHGNGHWSGDNQPWSAPGRPDCKLLYLSGKSSHYLFQLSLWWECPCTTSTTPTTSETPPSTLNEATTVSSTASPAPTTGPDPWTTVFSAPEKRPVVKDTLLTTLPVLTKGWRVSFEIFPTDYSYAGWANLLHLTIGGDQSQYGDRTPSIMFHPNYKMQVTSAINGNAYQYFYLPRPTIDQWTAIEITQQLEGVRYMFSINVGGKQVSLKENTDAREFSDVKVFASDSDHTAQAASIRNIKIETQN